MNTSPRPDLRSEVGVVKSWWEGGRWSIYQCSTQFPIDIECRLHVEPITDRQFGSHPPLAKTGLASAVYRLPIIRKGGILERPDSSPDPGLGYFPIISRSDSSRQASGCYCNVGSDLLMQCNCCEVWGVRWKRAQSSPVTTCAGAVRSQAGRQAELGSLGKLL